MSRRTPDHPNVGDGDDEIVVEDHKPLIPDGEYKARYLGHQTAHMFVKSPKVFLRFEICEGTYAGTRLLRPFRVARLTGRPGPQGKFQIKAGGDLYRMLVRLLEVKMRPDRVSLRPLRSMLLDIAVRTVTRDRNNQPLAPAAQYSVIDSICDGS